jgi:hypothetical protein
VRGGDEGVARADDAAAFHDNPSRSGRDIDVFKDGARADVVLCLADDDRGDAT